MFRTVGTPVAFKAAFTVEMPNNPKASVEDIRNYYDERIIELHKEKLKVLDTVEFMNTPEMQEKLKSLPSTDEIFYSPVSETENGDIYCPLLGYSAGKATEAKLDDRGTDHLLRNPNICLTADEGKDIETKDISNWLTSLSKMVNKAIGK